MLDRGSLLIFDSEAKEKNLPVNRKIENTYKIRGTFLINLSKILKIYLNNR